MACYTSKPLVLNVRKQSPELLKPAKATLHEYKPLSDIDDQDYLRCEIAIIQFYHNNTATGNRDPVKAIREAIEQALVFYYPFAGRLRELLPSKKLLVDCTGEGLLFVEADADVALEEFGELHPPFPCDELFCNPLGSIGLLDSPLLSIQVTRLTCKGFTVALCVNHAFTDLFGLVQFMKSIAEITRGAQAPSLLPIWKREIFMARSPPQVTCMHHEYDHVADAKCNFVNQTEHSFFFGSTEISAILKLVSPHFSKCATVDILTAFLWVCRTIALEPDAEEEMRVFYVCTPRSKMTSPPLPVGYYGNVVAVPVAVSKARMLCLNQLNYALELIINAKHNVTEEYMKSLTDYLVSTNPRPHLTTVRSFIVSDFTRAGLIDVNFGWGKAEYGGIAKVGGTGPISGAPIVYNLYTNKKGERGIMVPVCLPDSAMARFVAELSNIFKNSPKAAL